MTITIDRPETGKYLAQRYVLATEETHIAIRRIHACLIVEGGEPVPENSYLAHAGLDIWPTRIPFDLQEMIPAESPLVVTIGEPPSFCEIAGADRDIAVPCAVCGARAGEFCLPEIEPVEPEEEYDDSMPCADAGTNWAWANSADC